MAYYSLRRVGDVLLVRTLDELDEQTTRLIEHSEYVCDVLLNENGWRPLHIVWNLDATSLLSPYGAALFARLARSLRNPYGRLILVKPNHGVRKALERAGAMAKAEVFEDHLSACKRAGIEGHRCLGGILVEMGAIDKPTLESALSAQGVSRPWRRLGDLLLSVGLVGPDELSAALRLQRALQSVPA